jgi:hypothetical protein
MPTISEQYQATCDERHNNVVTKAQLLGWLLGIGGSLLIAAFAAGAANMRLNAVQEAQTQTQMQVYELEGERQRLATQVEVLANDLAWQSQTLALIADKLDVSTPRR